MLRQVSQRGSTSHPYLGLIPKIHLQLQVGIAA